MVTNKTHFDEVDILVVDREELPPDDLAADEVGVTQVSASQGEKLIRKQNKKDIESGEKKARSEKQIAATLKLVELRKKQNEEKRRVKEEQKMKEAEENKLENRIKNMTIPEGKVVVVVDKKQPKPRKKKPEPIPVSETDETEVEEVKPKRVTKPRGRSPKRQTVHRPKTTRPNYVDSSDEEEETDFTETETEPETDVETKKMAKDVKKKTEVLKQINKAINSVAPVASAPTPSKYVLPSGFRAVSSL
jgi:hypothetical protein